VLVARRHRDDQQPGGLNTLLATEREMVGFDTTAELIAQVRQALADLPAAQGVADRARLRCLTEHSPAARWQTISGVLSAVAIGSRP
jgi:type VI protein secretion system component VasK